MSCRSESCDSSPARCRRPASLMSHGVEGRAVVRQAAHRDAAAGAILEDLRASPSRRDRPCAARTSRPRSWIISERRPARCAFGPVARQAHQPLVLRLVVPVREKDGEQPQRVDMRARRAALRRVDAIELEEGPAVDFLRVDRPRVELALERDPFEVVIVLVVERLFVERRRARRLDDLAQSRTAPPGQPWHRSRGTSDTSSAPKPRTCRRRVAAASAGSSGPGAVLDADLVALDIAIELRRRTAQRVETESTGERLRSGLGSRESRARHGHVGLAPHLRPRERVESFRIRHDALVVSRMR